ncbi:hypothetical protein NPIL_148891 [Nephila pilipes]|uniref:Uncharacterized protein n=1 Tax=Nephila pilipes TaxID=299642 RepID=A0A8X6U969_NEPPI|nr:hypothetical protein NPIL_148891 [Nephila pilipes]
MLMGVESPVIKLPRTRVSFTTFLRATPLTVDSSPVFTETYEGSSLLFIKPSTSPRSANNDLAKYLFINASSLHFGGPVSIVLFRSTEGRAPVPRGVIWLAE